MRAALRASAVRRSRRSAPPPQPRRLQGALQCAEARAVWIGDVLIRHAAVGTDTYELNRNLILTDGARADSVPNLEIETGEVVGAGHASATGRFDDEQLFYLQSRGIPEDEARRLLSAVSLPTSSPRSAYPSCRSDSSLRSSTSSSRPRGRLRERLQPRLSGRRRPEGRRCAASSTAKPSRS